MFSDCKPTLLYSSYVMARDRSCLLVVIAASPENPGRNGPLALKESSLSGGKERRANRLGRSGFRPTANVGLFFPIRGKQVSTPRRSEASTRNALAALAANEREHLRESGEQVHRSAVWPDCCGDRERYLNLWLFAENASPQTPSLWRLPRRRSTRRYSTQNVLNGWPPKPRS